MHPDPALNRVHVPPFAEDPKAVNVIIETPQLSRVKLKFDDELGCFKYSKQMPAGSDFPFNFGYVPSTKADDGDPLDVLVLVDAPLPMGCLVECRPIGVLYSKQGKGKKLTEHNHRVLAVPEGDDAFEHIKEIDDLGATLVADLEHFFKQYKESRDDSYENIGRGRAWAARKLIEECARAFRAPKKKAA